MTKKQKKLLDQIKKIIAKSFTHFIGEPGDDKMCQILRKMWDDEIKPRVLKSQKHKVKVKPHPTDPHSMLVTITIWPTKFVEIPFEANEDEER